MRRMRVTLQITLSSCICRTNVSANLNNGYLYNAAINGVKSYQCSSSIVYLRPPPMNNATTLHRIAITNSTTITPTGMLFPKRKPNKPIPMATRMQASRDDINSPSSQCSFVHQRPGPCRGPRRILVLMRRLVQL